MPRVTPEDLLNRVIAADALRRRTRGLPSTRASQGLGLRHAALDRLFIEPLFNLLGLLWGQAMLLLPFHQRRSLVQWVNSRMSGKAPELNPVLRGHIERVVAAARGIQEKTGRWPALLILTSHPETEGPHQWLRFELLRQGLQIADAVVEAKQPGRWYAPHPKCFLAIDPFALDTVSSVVGAFYSGWMHRFYLTWDRQPSTQSWIQRHGFLRRTDYSRIGWRLLETLRKDIPVLMVLPGGLPCNARLLYAAREFVRRLPIQKWKIRRLQAQVELMEILMKPEAGACAADTGEIAPLAVQNIREALIRWGLEAGPLEGAIHELREEFRLPVPYRERLFKILIQRLPARGKPLLILGMKHSETAPQVRISEPWEVRGGSDAIGSARDFVRWFNV